MKTVLLAFSILFLAATLPAKETPAKPTLADVIVDSQHLKSALGTKALLITDLKTGEVPALLQADVKAAKLHEGIQLMLFPKSGVPPKAKSRQAPVYPVSLRRSGVPGQARFLFVISTDGTVTGIYCSAASRPEFALTGAAAIVKWRYEPARIQDIAVPIVVTTTLDFEPVP